MRNISFPPPTCYPKLFKYKEFNGTIFFKSYRKFLNDVITYTYILLFINDVNCLI